jgi:hypothetical protein
VLAQLAGQRNGDGWFTTADVRAAFMEWRLPAPSNISRELGGLRGQGRVIARSQSATRSAGWSLTPLGQTRVQEAIGNIDQTRLEPQLAHVPGTQFGEARMTVLPPGLAPHKWTDGINRLLARSPFETNVLCMTRFPRPELPDDPMQSVIDMSREVLKRHGLNLHLASTRIVEETLWPNVAAYTWACQFGVAFFEDRVGEGLNYNLVAEVGAMLIAGRQCALIRDSTAPDMPTDLIGHIYKPVDLDDLSGVANELHRWVSDDLDLGRCPICPVGLASDLG